jgi:hypothetical protein
MARRPDLLTAAELSEADRKYLATLTQNSSEDEGTP